MLLFCPSGRSHRHPNILPVGRGIHQLEGEGLKPIGLEKVVKFEAQGAHIAVAGDLKVDIVLLPGAWVLCGTDAAVEVLAVDDQWVAFSPAPALFTALLEGRCHDGQNIQKV